MHYDPLIETASLSDPTENLPSTSCRTCKNKLMKKQTIDHTPVECLHQRCEYLENEVTRLKDHDMKSRLQIKDLETKVLALEEVIKGLTTTKPVHATPFTFGERKKVHKSLEKANSEDLNKDINYDNIIRPPRTNSRERLGLFGTLGASSQHH